MIIAYYQNNEVIINEKQSLIALTEEVKNLLNIQLDEDTDILTLEFTNEQDEKINIATDEDFLQIISNLDSLLKINVKILTKEEKPKHNALISDIKDQLATEISKQLENRIYNTMFNMLNQFSSQINSHLNGIMKNMQDSQVQTINMLPNSIISQVQPVVETLQNQNDICESLKDVQSKIEAIENNANLENYTGKTKEIENNFEDLRSKVQEEVNDLAQLEDLLEDFKGYEKYWTNSNGLQKDLKDAMGGLKAKLGNGGLKNPGPVMGAPRNNNNNNNNRPINNNNNNNNNYNNNNNNYNRPANPPPQEPPKPSYSVNFIPNTFDISYNDFKSRRFNNIQFTIQNQGDEIPNGASRLICTSNDITFPDETVRRPIRKNEKFNIPVKLNAKPSADGKSQIQVSAKFVVNNKEIDNGSINIKVGPPPPPPQRQAPAEPPKKAAPPQPVKQARPSAPAASSAELSEEQIEKLIGDLDSEYNALSIFSKEEIVEKIKQFNGDTQKIQEALFG